jgi:hypothetical protein
VAVRVESRSKWEAAVPTELVMRANASRSSSARAEVRLTSSIIAGSSEREILADSINALV